MNNASQVVDVAVEESQDVKNTRRNNDQFFRYNIFHFFSDYIQNVFLTFIESDALKFVLSTHRRISL